MRTDWSRRDLCRAGGIALLSSVVDPWPTLGAAIAEVDPPYGRAILRRVFRAYPSADSLSLLRLRGSLESDRGVVIRWVDDAELVLQVRAEQFILSARASLGQVILKASSSGLQRVAALADSSGGGRVRDGLSDFDTVVQTPEGVLRTFSSSLAVRHGQPVLVPGALLPVIYDQTLWLVCEDLRRVGSGLEIPLRPRSAWGHRSCRRNHL